MKLAGFENIDSGVRSAILISVAAAYFAFDLGFELGAHGTIFFEKVFFVWSISLWTARAGGLPTQIATTTLACHPQRINIHGKLK